MLQNHLVDCYIKYGSKSCKILFGEEFYYVFLILYCSFISLIFANCNRCILNLTQKIIFIDEMSERLKAIKEKSKLRRKVLASIVSIY